MNKSRRNFLKAIGEGALVGIGTGIANYSYGALKDPKPSIDRLKAEFDLTEKQAVAIHADNMGENAFVSGSTAAVAVTFFRIIRRDQQSQQPAAQGVTPN